MGSDQLQRGLEFDIQAARSPKASIASKIVVREAGQDVIEYALLAGLISIVALALIILVGPYLDSLFRDVINVINLG